MEILPKLWKKAMTEHRFEEDWQFWLNTQSWCFPCYQPEWKLHPYKRKRTFLTKYQLRLGMAMLMREYADRLFPHQHGQHIMRFMRIMRICKCACGTHPHRSDASQNDHKSKGYLPVYWCGWCASTRIWWASMRICKYRQMANPSRYHCTVHMCLREMRKFELASSPKEMKHCVDIRLWIRRANVHQMFKR